MDIRTAKKEHIEEIVQLCLRLWREHHAINPAFSLHPDIQNTQRRWLRKAIASRDARVIIAIDSGVVVATATATVSNSSIFWPERYGYLRDIYVEDTYRRQGIGSALTDDLMRWLHKRGATWVELAALSDNIAANQYWQSRGFEQLFNIYRRNVADSK